MNKIGLFIACLLPIFLQAQDFQTPFEQNNNYSASYTEVIEFYKALQIRYPDKMQMLAHGSTDAGHPLHTIVIDQDGDFTATQARDNGKLIVFVDNGIHPGEPCGIDASMMLVRDYLTGKLNAQILDKTTLVVVPVYNIGGSLNRTAYSRANQQGPELYGFRGNTRNYDLNRDFIKADTRNAQTFNQIYGQWKPHIFIDTHTSNGADYQYSMTLIATQHNKLQSDLGQYMNQKMLPYLYQSMEERNWEMIPYVYARSTPDQGIAGFLDLPRYSSGYAALHNAFSFMPETHMLKPFKNRVLSTYHFIDAMLNFVAKENQVIIDLRQKADQKTSQQTSFDLNWELDQSKADSISFKGYTAKYKPSLISGKDRLYYDQAAPYTITIPYLNYYKANLSVEKPIAYIIPQAYQELIERLQWNGVKTQRLQADVRIETEHYKISDYQSRRSPYEGHYLHYGVQVVKDTIEMQFYKGDVVVYANQASNRYIVETLEPQAPDSYFAWNFFDAILQRKEYFSSYVFEDTAYEYLNQHPELKEALEKAKAADPELAKSGRAQLNFIYQRSPYSEPTYQRYPVGRLIREQKLPLGN